MLFARVSVICLCHNQALFVEEAMQSVLAQSWPEVELIVVDDASSDNSVEVIRNVIGDRRDIQFIALEKNVGNCAAFNTGYRYATGEYCIDLAADDILLPARVEKGVRDLEEAGDLFGITFSDCELIAANGQVLGKHSDRFPHAAVPSGDVYREVISRYFICSPTVMFRRQVMDDLDGYDASLSYEDFDFWVRSSRDYYYSYVPEVLVKKRLVRNSLSEKQFRLFSQYQRSTLEVTKKIFKLNRTADEHLALRRRLWYEWRQSLKQLNFRVSLEFLALLRESYRMDI